MIGDENMALADTEYGELSSGLENTSQFSQCLACKVKAHLKDE